MPNFGKLDQDLIGGTLTIGDRLVLDGQLNLIVSNIHSGNIFGILFTNQLVENVSTQGIQVYGNLHIADGFYLTGDIIADSTTVTQLNVLGMLTTPVIKSSVSGIGPTLLGNTTVSGNLGVVGDIIAPVIHTDSLVSDVVLLNTISPRTGSTIELFGNLHLLGGELFVDIITNETNAGIVLDGNVIIGGSQLMVPSIFTDRVTHITANGIVVDGNVHVLNGCLTLEKSDASANVTNIVTTNRSAGRINYYSQSSFFPLDEHVIQMHNPCISNSSVVMSLVGTHIGLGTPYVLRTEVHNGYANIFLTNFSGNTIPTGNTIELQYLIM